MSLNRFRVAFFAGLALAASPAQAQDIATKPVPLKVMSFNIWYGGEQVDFAGIIEAIKVADPDIVGLQEPDGNTARIAAAAGYPYVDTRRHIISKFPLFDSGVGERLETSNPPYSIAGVGDHAVHAWAMVAPGMAVAVANTHLTSNPYGPELAREGETADAVIAGENEIRLPEAQALVDGLKPVADSGVPVFLTGDFNAPSWRDWVAETVDTQPERKFALAWPVSRLIEDAGFADSFRAVHPDPVAVLGETWTPGYPAPFVRETETQDRIDFVFAANAKAIDSVLVGEAGNAAVAISVTPWPSDHRAVLSTFEVVPTKAPALIAVEPPLVVASQPFVIRVNSPDQAIWGAVVVPRGGDAAKDGLTGIAGIEPYDRTTIKLSTIGMDPGAYDAVMINEAGGEITRTRFSVVGADQKAEIEVLTPDIAEGADLAVRWSGAPGLRFDWVGVYRRNEPNAYNYLSFTYTGARREGEMTIPAADLFEPLTPGDYELRLLLDDHYETLAVTPFTVKTQ